MNIGNVSLDVRLVGKSEKLKTHIFIAQIQELFKLDSTVGEGTEGSLLLEVGGDLGVGNGGISLSIEKWHDHRKINRQHFILLYANRRGSIVQKSVLTILRRR